MNGTRPVRGECLCRAVGYEVAGAFEYALICHCSNCRRATGSAFKPFAAAPADALAIVRGFESVTRFGEESNHDVRCGTCGSLLFSLVRDGSHVHVTMGTLIDMPGIRPTAHIFVGSKASWHSIGDDLPQYDELPPD